MTKVKEARVAVESFRPYYDHIMRYARARFIRKPDNFGSWNRERPHSLGGAFDKEAFCVWSGLTPIEASNLRAYMSKPDHVSSIPLNLADKLMTAYGIPDQVCQLYLVTTSAGRGTGMSYNRYERELCLAA